MKTLLVLRHAKSNWNDTTCSDHDRALNNRGKRTAPLVGQLIADEDVVPNLILSSTAKRARETAYIVGEHCEYKGVVELSEKLYPTSAAACIDVLSEIDDVIETLLLVGHNPGLENLVEHLTGDFEVLPTAALVQMSLDVNEWSEISPETAATRLNLWRPREVFE